MADKSVGELIAATSVTPTDLFVLEQNGTAKKLTGQVLENWLVSFADGHGGIHSIVKESTSGLVDTYRITLSDTTTFDFLVTNGKSISKIAKTTTNGLVDTYTITYNDSATTTFTVTNGAKGDKGDNQYVWIKYASQKPTDTSHSFGDVADDWIGIYSGESSTAPTDWQQYEWFQIKGEKGETGAAATLISTAVEYQVSDSGTIIPSGAWFSSVPIVAQGKYLWTRNTQNFNTGAPVVSYSVSRMGLDGAGSVSSVANISPDKNGNVPLTAENVGALPSTGGNMTGLINMNGQPISGLNDPTANDQAANMGFVNQQVKKAIHRNIAYNSDWSNPMNQRGQPVYDAGVYTIDRWYAEANGASSVLQLNSGYITMATHTTTAKWVTQRYEDNALKAGESYTVAVWLHDGSVLVNNATIPQNGGSVDLYLCEKFQARLTHNSFGLILWNKADGNISYNITHVGLFKGVYTAETLPEYQPNEDVVDLMACLVYFHLYATEAERPSNGLDCSPPMRIANVTQGTIEIDGTTYYYNSADL